VDPTSLSRPQDTPKAVLARCSWKANGFSLRYYGLPAGAERESEKPALHELWFDGFGLRTAFSTWQVEDSPELSTGRHAVEDPERAKSFWRFEEPATFANAA